MPLVELPLQGLRHCLYSPLPPTPLLVPVLLLRVLVLVLVLLLVLMLLLLLVQEGYPGGQGLLLVLVLVLRLLLGRDSPPHHHPQFGLGKCGGVTLEGLPSGRP